MQTRGHLILKALVSRYHPKSPELLFKFLSRSEADQLKSTSLESSDITSLIYHPQRLVKNLHSTWIEKLIQKAPVSVKPLLSSPLPSPFEPLTINILFSLLDKPPVLPPEHLPKSELLPLATWNSEQLDHLAALLGLFDLAAELRFFVDKVSIQNLFSCLPEHEQNFLKICSQQKETVSVPRLNIDPHKKAHAEWRRLFHERGVLRIARALNGQNYNLVWYIAHTMNVTDGSVISKAYSDKPIAKITPVLYSQMIQAMDFLKKIGKA